MCLSFITFFSSPVYYFIFTRFELTFLDKFPLATAVFPRNLFYFVVFLFVCYVSINAINDHVNSPPKCWPNVRDKEQIMARYCHGSNRFQRHKHVSIGINANGVATWLKYLTYPTMYAKLVSLISRWFIQYFAVTCVHIVASPLTGWMNLRSGIRDRLKWSVSVHCIFSKPIR
jgi:uncharacterized membrane protein YjdF